MLWRRQFLLPDSLTYISCVLSPNSDDPKSQWSGSAYAF